MVGRRGAARHRDGDRVRGGFLRRSRTGWPSANPEASARPAARAPWHRLRGSHPPRPTARPPTSSRDVHGPDKLFTVKYPRDWTAEQSNGYLELKSPDGKVAGSVACHQGPAAQRATGSPAPPIR
ncbi:hypothetical protein QJS66_12890 [Kocuria rhizophila]|nr:hypothetical protein QJS66_12890 [Kocuria rhizophila]